MSPEQLNAALLQRLDRLEKLMVAQAEQMKAKDALIDALNTQNAKLQSELEEWKAGLRGPQHRRKGRRRVRGARSAKEQPEPKPDSPHRPSGRKEGHKGAGRKKPSNIDVVEHRRLESCPDCSGELADLGVRHRHTTEDIVLTVSTTQYQLHKHHCDACQKTHLAPLPENLGGAVRIGPRALALAAWMRFDMRQSIGNIARFFTEGIGLSWSKGSISRRLAKLIDQLAPVTNQLWEDLLNEPVLHVDETGWKEDGYRRWLWNGSGEHTTCFHITSQRNRDSLEEMIPNNFDGIVVTDGYTAYNQIPTGQHAECWAHVLRKARDAWEVHEHPSDGVVFIAVTRFLRGARWYQAQWKMSKIRPQEHESRLRTAFTRIVKCCEVASTARLVSMGKWLSRHPERYLLFLNHEAVPLTNNAAERELRSAVIMRKTSFGSRNVRGSQTLADGWTIMGSIKKQGGSWFEFIDRAISQIARDRVPPLIPSTPK